MSARDHLQATRDELSHLRALVSARDTGRIASTLESARWHAAEARRLTGGPDWGLLTHLPVAGPGATTVRALADSAAELTDVLAGVRRAGMEVMIGRDDSPDDARRLLADMRQAAPELDGAVARLGRARSRLAATPPHTRFAVVDQARTTALTEFDRLEEWLGGAADAAALLPPMLGIDGPRRLFLAFQTNAEARGTGGLVGAFGILETDHGKVRVTRLAANNEIDAGPPGRTVQRRSGGPSAGRILSVSNLSPHFPYAASTWTDLWKRQTGRRLDGAIALDPVGLSYLLGLTGPVTLPGGEHVTAANVVDLTERVAYARYTDPVARKRYLIRIARAVSGALPESFTRPSRVLPVLKAMIEDRRIQVWSRHAAEERRLARTPVGGVLPEEPGPYAQLVVNNSAGGKLDYYLDRSLDYELGPCRAGSRVSKVRIGLSNNVPDGTLPGYVTSRLDSPGRPHVAGSNLLWVSLYASVGAKLTGVRLDGQPFSVSTRSERSHPVYSLLLELAPKQSRTLELDLLEPVSDRPPVVPVQPLARSQRTRIQTDPRGCAP